MAAKQSDESSTPPAPEALNNYPFWSPRFWHGMRLRAFLGLLWRNGLRIHPLRIGMALIIIPCAAMNSILYRIQNLIYGRRIAATQIEQPPIFIIGHWRSGTTFLHELLVRDDRFTFPTTYECFAPNHFLISGSVLPKLVKFLLPKKRPMDNMEAGFDRPQEDEFALCAMGAPTPYCRMAFPNNPEPYPEFLNMVDPDEGDLRRFRDALRWFVACLTFQKKKRVVLKSPPHTGRIATLADLFPGARFIHIVRDPVDLFPSTRRTWQALDVAQAFQVPNHRDLDDYIFRSLERMYDGFHRGREQIDPSHLCELRYEDLAKDPIGEVEKIYEKLDLGDFDHVRDDLQKYVSAQKDYRTNRHSLDPEIQQQINVRWRDYMERYGYEPS